MRVADLMRRLIPPASYVLFLFFLTGIWLVMSPFVMTTQPAGTHWIASTINNVSLGGVLMFVSLVGILGYAVLAVQDILRETQAKQAADEMAVSH